MSGQTEDRRFTKPWVVIEHEEAFEVRSANGFRIAYVYYEDEKSRADISMRPNKKQGLQIANRIAKIGANE